MIPALSPDTSLVVYKSEFTVVIFDSALMLCSFSYSHSKCLLYSKAPSSFFLCRLASSLNSLFSFRCWPIPPPHPKRLLCLLLPISFPSFPTVKQIQSPSSLHHFTSMHSILSPHPSMFRNPSSTHVRWALPSRDA